MSLTAARDRALEFVDRLQELGPISVTRFFGGAGLAKHDVQFAFVIKGVLYLRVDDLSRPDFEASGAAPFSYTSRSRTVKVASYYELPDEIAEDPESLLRWVTRALHASRLATVHPVDLHRSKKRTVLKKISSSSQIPDQ